MLWIDSSSRTRRDMPNVSSACPAYFSMLYRNMSCNLASMGSDLGILPVDMRGGTDMGIGRDKLMAGLACGAGGNPGNDWLLSEGAGDSGSGLVGLLLSNLTGGLALPSSL